MINHVSRFPLGKGDEVEVFFFCDLQSDADGFMPEAWAAFKSRFKASPGAMAMGIGDYGDWMRPTMRGRLGAALSGDDSVRQQLDSMVRRQQDRLLDKMQFLEGRLIGIHNGHHCHEFADGTNSDQRLASALKAPYLGWMATTRLVLAKRRTKGLSTYTYTMVSLHGNANSRKTGGAANWTEDNIMRAWIADQYVVGHCCKNMAWVPHERKFVRRKGPAGIDTKLPRCLQVPGFHSGYTESGGYVERNSFPPQPLGWGVLKFKITANKRDSKIAGLGNRGNVLTVKQNVEYFEQ